MGMRVLTQALDDLLLPILMSRTEIYEERIPECPK
jgi:hypothetical protein